MITADGPIRVGVLLPTREQAIQAAYGAAPLLDFARQAEALGFDSLWTGDSLTARPRLDPLAVLAAAGAVTSTIALGTAALTPALRPAVLGANMVTSLDQVCGGRLVLGVGSGFPVAETEQEFAAVGVPFQRRARRLHETVELWRTAWSADQPGAPVDYRGSLVCGTGLNRLPRPVRPGAGPPVWLAGSDTPVVLDRVARTYDGWMPFLPTAEAYGAAWRQIESRRAAAGRPAGAVTPALYATITVGDRAADARAELKDYIHKYYGRSLEQMSAIQAYGWGSAESCAQWLAGYVRAGARHIVVRIGSLDPEPQLKAIASVLAPAVRAA